MCWNKYIIHIFGLQKNAQSPVKNALCLRYMMLSPVANHPVDSGLCHQVDGPNSTSSLRLGVSWHREAIKHNISCLPSPQISSPVQDTSRVELMSMRQWHVVRGCQAQPPWFSRRYLQIFCRAGWPSQEKRMERTLTKSTYEWVPKLSLFLVALQETLEIAKCLFIIYSKLVIDYRQRVVCLHI